MADKPTPQKLTGTRTPEEKAKLARRLAGIPEPAGSAEAAQEPTEIAGRTAVAAVPTPLTKDEPWKHEEWWRNHLGALLLVKDAIPPAGQVVTGAPLQMLLEAISPNGQYIRLRATGATAFTWRVRTAVAVCDVLAYPEEIQEFDKAWLKFYPKAAAQVNESEKKAAAPAGAEAADPDPAA